MKLKRNHYQLFFLALLFINASTVFAQARDIFADNFKKDKGLWVSEFEQSATSSMKISQGKLDVIATAGGTVWYKNKLKGNIMITYYATVVDAGGKNDRVTYTSISL